MKTIVPAKPDDFFSIGKVKKCYEHKNQILLETNEYCPESFDEDEFVFLNIGGQFVPFRTLNSRKRSSNTLLLTLKNNFQKYLPPFLPKSEAFLLKEDYSISESDSFESFAGFSLYDQNNERIGLIETVHHFPSHSNFALSINGQEILIPVNDDLIIEVLSNEKRIKIEIADGLIDLFLNRESADDLFD